jgi:hypothetical protein
MRSCTVQCALCVCGGLEGLWVVGRSCGRRGESRVVDIIENRASLQSRTSVEEGATRGSHLTFLLEATGATTKLEHE